MPQEKVAILCRLAAPELLMLSNGLPPPLPMLPDFIDCASAGDMLVLLAGVVCVLVAFDVVGGDVVLTNDGGDCVVDNVALFVVDVTVEVFAVELESVTSPVVIGFVDDRTIVLLLIEVVDADSGTMEILVASPPRPVVVVTTATLHSICIPFPSLNNPMMLVSSTSAVWQLLLIRALICTSPARHAFEHTEFAKSATVQPGIVWSYTTLHCAGRLSVLGTKSERATAEVRVVSDSSARAVSEGLRDVRMVL
jgi:hypothetical protein